jgi:hypothetical protein
MTVRRRSRGGAFSLMKARYDCRTVAVRALLDTPADDS